ncbi:MAG: 2-C-methyl-D-erythritol 2,4-cyclodiphosphate synthase [Candidatus Zixiibacteriota bacterium]
MELRIGHGFDVHPLIEGRNLMVGGVKIPYEKGLAGHSDGDVLLHAIMDALLGAAGLPDIGQQFPPTDRKYKNADSTLLLKSVVQVMKEAGFTEIINIDATIIAEEPKMNTYIHLMKRRIAEAVQTETSRINIKATTTERLGFVGRGEGVAASAVCLIAGNG